MEASIRTFDGLLPENKRADVVKQREEEARKVEGQDPVPKGIKDIRALMDKRLKSLDNSGLPFTTAAAAVIKGNQPTLVALTNAMIGYTAGDEQLKKARYVNHERDG